MRYETWLYALKGERTMLYIGRSEAKAQAAMTLAANVISTYRLNGMIEILSCVGYLHLNATVVKQVDYWDGAPDSRRRHSKKELKLALDSNGR